MSYTTDAFNQPPSFDEVFDAFNQPPSFGEVVDDIDERCSAIALSAILPKNYFAGISDDETVIGVSPFGDSKPSFDFKTVCEQKDPLLDAPVIACPPDIARTLSRTETDAQPHGRPARKPKNLTREIRALPGEVSTPSHMAQTASRTRAMYPLSARRRGESASSSEASNPLSDRQPTESASSSEAMSPLSDRQSSESAPGSEAPAREQKIKPKISRRDALNQEVIDAIRSGNLQRVRKLIAVPAAIRAKAILIGRLVEEMKTITNPEIKSLVNQYIDKRRLCNRKVKLKKRY